MDIDNFINEKEKAIELVNKFYPFTWQVCEDYEKDNEQAKYCALISVSEILNPVNHFITTKEQLDFWIQVKEEINKI